MIHIRQRAAPTQQTLELPRDVLWLRRGTAFFLLVLALLALGLGLRALAQMPWFSIARIQVVGDTQYHNALTLRANVLPALSGNFFTVNLRTAQQQLQALPWVQSATVRRVFPNQLVMSLVTHVPVARWGHSQPESEIERLLNAQGEIFEATSAQLNVEELPQLAGADAASGDVLRLYQNLSLELPRAFPGVTVTQLIANPQGLWQATLSNKARLELGSGSVSEVTSRVKHWLGALPLLRGQAYNLQALQSLDLRYPNGFAMRLAGVTTEKKDKSSKRK